jgi:hypothetical protein
MALNKNIEHKLKKRYEPSTMVELKYNGNALSFKTDEEGNPILLFIGKKDETGKVKGERYARTLKKDTSGAVIKDHWELKGKAT